MFESVLQPYFPIGEWVCAHAQGNTKGKQMPKRKIMFEVVTTPPIPHS